MSDEPTETLADRLATLRQRTCCYSAEELDALLADVRAEATGELSAELGLTKAALEHERERVDRLHPALIQLHATTEALLADRNFLVQQIEALAVSKDYTPTGARSGLGNTIRAATIDHPNRPGKRSQP